jgi:hypothetical protein
MPITKRNLRGLREIRSMSGQADEASLPHRAHMKLACLEMEKARRKTERNVAMQRVKNIDARLQDIEKEEAAIKRVLVGKADHPARDSSGGEAESGHACGRKRPFKIKY